MAEELKGLLDEAIKAEKLIGSGIPTKAMKKFAEIDPSDLAKILPDVMPKFGDFLAKAAGEVQTADPKEVTGFLKNYMGPAMENMTKLDPTDFMKVMPQMMPAMAGVMDKMGPVLEGMEIDAMTDLMKAMMEPMTPMMDTMMGSMGEIDMKEVAGMVPDMMPAMADLVEKMVPMLEKIDLEALYKVLPDIISPITSGLMDRMQDMMGGMEMETEDVEKMMAPMGEYMPRLITPMMGIMDRIIEADEEIKNELAGAEDMVFNIKMGDVLQMSMGMKGGKLEIGTELAPEPDLSIEIPMSMITDMMSGAVDPMSAFMGGDVKMEGDMSKAMGLMPLMTVFTEKFGIEIM
jgi:putative sterol carrier protein